MTKLRLLKKPGTLTGVSTNFKRRAKYYTDQGYRAEKTLKARIAYRKKANLELDNCLKSLTFFYELAENRKVKLPNGQIKNYPVMSIPTAAKALQKLYQTFWRWVDRQQVPVPILKPVDSSEPVYHAEEVRVLIEEVGNHEKEVAYYRRDHIKVRNRIFSRIGKVRQKLGME